MKAETIGLLTAVVCCLVIWMTGAVPGYLWGEHVGQRHEAARVQAVAAVPAVARFDSLADHEDRLSRVEAQAESMASWRKRVTDKTGVR